VQARSDVNGETKTIFGEALAFYKLKIDDVVQTCLVLYHSLVDVKQTLGQIRGKWDRSVIHVANISTIVDIVGIWEPENESRNTYILRKHLAIALLNTEELGKDSEVDGNEDLTEESAARGLENA
jgi:hypothetical protein